MSIDYGRHAMSNGSLPNRNPETGIRYGIVSMNDLNEYALDSFEPVYDCEDCECEDCCDCECEPVGWTYEEEGYSLSLDEHNDVWVFRSPHTTSRWSHCSPCAPGAAYLRGDEDHGDALAYCLGNEWYDNGKDE